MASLNSYDDRNRFHFWNTAPADPLALAKKAGTVYHNGRPLMPESAMPVGEHLGKTMRQVPRDYLRWVDAQPWAAQWPAWERVRDYLTRFPETAGAGALETVIFVDVLTPCTPSPAWRWPQVCHLHCLPGHEDRLHAFALGALGLPREWARMSHGGMPHYDLNESKQDRALGCGAELCDRRQMGLHIQLWRAHLGLPTVPEYQRQMPDGTRRCTKHCYGSESEAERVRERILHGNRATRNARKYFAQGSRTNTPDYLRSYHCDLCGFWHLTKKRPD